MNTNENINENEADHEEILCADCGCAMDAEDHAVNAKGNLICESCFEDSYSTCKNCGEVFNRDDLLWNDHAEETICEDCADHLFSTCEDCGKYIWDGEAVTLANNDTLCMCCYEHGDYCTCDDCGDIHHADNMCFTDDGCYCEICYYDHAEEEEEEDSNIQEYSYKPTWDYYSASNESQNARMLHYFGVELEVENKAGRVCNNDAAGEVLDHVNAVCKTDGSINNGFEIVMHPMTFAYANGEGKQGISDMLDYLRSKGFAGHNYAGMHVHISRAAFSRLHLYKFHRLFQNTQTLLTTLSQRKAINLDRWAGFGNIPKVPVSFNDNRYAALNYGRHTVEVRIFNSTLREDRFFKNLEVCKAAIDFSKQHGIAEMNEVGFIKFIFENRHLYRNLAAFLVEKQSRILRVVNVSAKAITQIEKRIARQAV